MPAVDLTAGSWWEFATEGPSVHETQLVAAAPAGPAGDGPCRQLCWPRGGRNVPSFPLCREGTEAQERNKLTWLVISSEAARGI